MRSYKFRIYPTKKQEAELIRHLNLCRFAYNKSLEFMNNQDKIDRSKIQHNLVDLKQEYPELKDVYSKTLQYETHKLFNNLSVLLALKKKGIKVGRLRFKAEDSFKTIVYSQSGFKVISTDTRYDRLKLSKIGEIRLVKHRDYEGNIKIIILKRKTDSWEAIIVTDAKYTLDSGSDEIGIDLGILSLMTDSDGEKIDNPLFLNRSLTKLNHLNRKLSKSKLKSKNRKRIKKRINKLWEHISNQRQDYFHKISTILVNGSKLIGIEDLSIDNMVTKTEKTKYYNMRNILDSSWGILTSMIILKAESAGVIIREVNPYNTSKTCSNCGNIQDMPLSERIYNCPRCGLKLDRDHNAAINILKLAREPGSALHTLFTEDYVLCEGFVNQEVPTLIVKSLRFSC